jgi:hypothetical protein
MLRHWLIDLIGHVSGLSEAQLKEIEKSLPATKTLIDILNRGQPIMEQAQSLYAEADGLFGTLIRATTSTMSLRSGSFSVQL